MLVDARLIRDQPDALVANQTDRVTHQDGNAGAHGRRRGADMNRTRAGRREHETEKQRLMTHGWWRVMAVVGICLIACSRAPERAPTPTEAPLAQMLRDTVRGALTRALADSAFPGAIAIVGNRAGELAEVEVGRLTWGEPAMVDRHTLWDMASLTKVMGTTMSIMRLVDAGKVEVDAPVQRYLPDWIGPGKSTITRS